MAIKLEIVDNFEKTFIEVDLNWCGFVANRDYVLDVGGFVPGLLAQQ